MQFELISARKLKVTLSRYDLTSLDTSYDRLCSGKPDTVRLLSDLLSFASDKVGFSTGKQHLSAEVFPESDGGCFIFFTMPYEQDAPKAVAAYRFDSSESLSAVCRLLKGEAIKSSLYRYNCRYFLTVALPISKKSMMLLGEFCDFRKSQDLFFSCLKEYSACIIESGAVEKIAEYF